MLFYGFKLECKYEGEETLEKACAESRREGWDAVARVNDALYDENEDARYVFISKLMDFRWMEYMHSLFCCSTPSYRSMKASNDTLDSSYPHCSRIGPVRNVSHHENNKRQPVPYAPRSASERKIVLYL